MRSRAKITVNRKAAKKKKTVMPRWVPYAAAITLTAMIVLTVNYRAFTEFSRERAQNTQLQEEALNLTDENIALQEEIHYLKTDPKRIEREARKFGLRPRQEKISAPAK